MRGLRSFPNEAIVAQAPIVFLYEHKNTMGQEIIAVEKKWLERTMCVGGWLSDSS